METVKDQLSDFLEEFWYAPQDALLRAFEADLWQNERLESLVLDIGCGDGRISNRLFKDKNLDIGVELEHRLAKQAERCGIYTYTLVTDAKQLSFKNESLQTIISNSTFEHIDKDKAAIREVTRVLTKGGTFIFTVPTADFKKALRKLVNNQERFNVLNLRLRHFHFRTLKDWKVILKSSGLKIERFKEYFPSELVLPWLRLLSVAIWKPYRRELWSYLKDSPYGKYVPAKYIHWLIMRYLNSYLSRDLKGTNCFILIRARKPK